MEFPIALRHLLPLIYLATINLLALFLYALDKISARAGSWRVRERTLLVLALLGGSAGALLAMVWFRHKTRKPFFGMLFAIILLAQLALIVFVLGRPPLDYKLLPLKNPPAFEVEGL